MTLVPGSVGRRPKPPKALQTQLDWELLHAYRAVLKAEEALEMAGFEHEARVLRRFRLHNLSGHGQ
jgi:hypothetical protein